MVWIEILFILIFVLYVVFSLSTIKYQLKLISEQLNVKEKETEKVSNEEIEKELEDYSRKNK